CEPSGTQRAPRRMPVTNRPDGSLRCCDSSDRSRCGWLVLMRFCFGAEKIHRPARGGGCQTLPGTRGRGNTERIVHGDPFCIYGRGCATTAKFLVTNPQLVSIDRLV